MDETFGQLVYRLRKERNWTQEKLKEVSGVPVRTIQDIEGDLREKPQRATMLKLRQALDIEGDPVKERSEWPEQVATILDIVGAWLVLQTPSEQIQWLADFIRQTTGEQPSTEE